MMPERRFPRISTENVVLVNRLGDDEFDGFVRTREMGAGGCCFVSSEEQKMHNFLRLLISVRHEVIEARAKVVYVNTLEDERFEIGVEFLEMKEEDRSRIAALFEKEAPILQA